MEDVSLNINSNYLGEITCINSLCISIDDKELVNFLFIGCGNKLIVKRVYVNVNNLTDIPNNENNQLSTNLFVSERITGININKCTFLDNSIYYLITVYAENKLKYSVVSLKYIIESINNTNNSKSLDLNKCFTFEDFSDYLLNIDWILDAIIVTNKSNINSQIISNVNKNNYLDSLYLIIGYSNNLIEIYSLSTFDLLSRLFNNDKCIVYSLSIYNNYNEIKNKHCFTVASGSIFQSIILWKFDLNLIIKNYYNSDIFNSSSTSIIKSQNYLKGHQGVIFKIKFINEFELLSVSDDRTVRYWELDINQVNGNKSCFTIEKCKVFIAHTSRVWNADFFSFNNKDSKYIVSVGEDTICRIFDLNTCKEVYNIHNHSGKNIRGLCIYNNNLCEAYNSIYVITGGDDGCVYYNNIKLKENNTNKLLNELDIYGSIKKINSFVNVDTKEFGYIKIIKIFFENEGNSLIFNENTPILFIGTSKGLILRYNYKENSLKSIINLLDIEITELNVLNIFLKTLIIIGGSKGDLLIYSNSECKIIFKENIFNFKVCFIYAKDNIIFLSNPVGYISFLVLNNANNNLKLDHVKLEHNSETCYKDYTKFQITACDIQIKEQNDKDLIIVLLGDVKGRIIALLFKKIEVNNTIKFINVANILNCKLHKNDPISKIYIANKSNYEDNIKVFSTGKDGVINQFEIEISQDKNCYSFYFKLFNKIMHYCLNSIENIFKLKNNDYYLNNLLVIGSLGNELVIYNTYNNSIFYKENIGGLNRVFNSISFLQPNNYKDFSIYYSYNNNGVVNLSKIEIQSNNNYNSNKLYGVKTSGKIIHCVKILETNIKDIFILISASEDTLISFYLYNSSKSKIIYLNSLNCHTGSVRDLLIIYKYTNKLTFTFILVSLGASCECIFNEIKIHLKLNKNTDDEYIFDIIEFNLIKEFKNSKKDIDSRILCGCYYEFYDYKIISCIDSINELSIIVCYINKNNSLVFVSSNNYILSNDYVSYAIDTYSYPILNNKKTNFLNVFTGDTNGNINITKVITYNNYNTSKNSVSNNNTTNNNNDSIDFNNDIKQLYKFKLSNCGINKVKLIKTSYYLEFLKLLIAACCEDGSVKLLSIKHDNNSYLSLNYEYNIIKNFSYHISSTKCLDTFITNNSINIVSSGYDQLIYILNLQVNENDGTIIKYTINKLKTSVVPEINALSVLSITESITNILIGGHGLEVIKY